MVSVLCRVILKLSVRSLTKVSFSFSAIMSAAGKLAKPQMRGMLVATIKKTIAEATVLSIITGTIIWWNFGRQRKINYAEFYKNYDAEKDFKRMWKSGVFKPLDGSDDEFLQEFMRRERKFRRLDQESASARK